MGKTEKAQVEGIEELFREDKEENGELSQQELMDKLVEIASNTLSEEVRGDAIGAYDDSGMYNIPFGTSEKSGGKLVWKECDMMPGECPYKGTKMHTHQVDVGIRGAEYAMQAYGHITMKQTLPRIETIDDQKMWIAEIEFKDTIKRIEFNDFFMQPVMKKAYDYESKSYKLMFDEYGYAIAISKCMRKGILRLIPGALRAKWIKAYREGGGNPFTKESVEEFRQERKEEVQEAKAEPEPQTHEEADFGVIFNDLIAGMNNCKTKESLQGFMKENEKQIDDHPAKETLKTTGRDLYKKLPKED